jgi:predicted O-methyltransferase YrrM
MIKDALRYARHAPQMVAAIAGDPVEALFTLQTKLIERREHRRPRCLYALDHDWEAELHQALGEASPCQLTLEFWELWPRVMAELREKGLEIGPASFGMWNDGEPEMVRAVWCLVRHLRPHRVIETGVARGLTTRFILEALERNGRGRLWSIDRPPPLDRALHAQIGAAVGNRYAHRWSYIKGSSRRRLPGLLSELGGIDLLIHDSMHTEHNVRFEMDCAWAALTPGGAVVVDDVDLNWGFQSFIESHRDHRSMVCQAEPLRPDMRRFDGKGLFGIVLKAPAKN